MKISIIIPIYNVAQDLPQCFDSLGVLGRSDVEVIFVNDGSTDEGEAICAKYERKWGNLRLINKANGGLSDARNCGTIMAK